jgi:hypothetical protein
VAGNADVGLRYGNYLAFEICDGGHDAWVSSIG